MPKSSTNHVESTTRSKTPPSNPLSLVGAKISYIESFVYGINENDLFTLRRACRAGFCCVVCFPRSAFVCGLLFVLG
ncbi:chloride channel protein CLC-b [Trifolium repens]|nr:chloride channel protein CLC-b [Trifolium repens]